MGAMSSLSRVAMAGAVVAGVVAGAPLAVAQPVPVPPAGTPASSTTTAAAPTATSAVPTQVPALPTELPAQLQAQLSALPTALPTGLPTQIPGLPPLPTQIPGLPPLAVPGVSSTPTSAPAPVATTAVPAATATQAVTSTVAAAPVSTCTPWTVGTIADGFGVLENLAFDGHGKMLLSESPVPGEGAVRTLTPAGAKGTLVSGTPSPGGLVVRDGRVVFTTGNNVMAGMMNGTNGTVESVRLDGSDRTVIAKGLTMPNGLAALENGDLLVTQAFGDKPGLTRIPATGSREPQRVRTDLGSANGLAVSTDGATVYVGNTVDRDTELRALQASDLTGAVSTTTVSGAGAANAGDDLTVGADGYVYMALNGAGKVVRIAPATGDTCEIATGLPLTSSVRFGAGDGWDAASLYTTSFTGAVHRLTPPTS